MVAKRGDEISRYMNPFLPWWGGPNRASAKSHILSHIVSACEPTCTISASSSGVTLASMGVPTRTLSAADIACADLGDDAQLQLRAVDCNVCGSDGRPHRHYYTSAD